MPILFLSFKHLFIEVGVDDDDGAFCCCSAYLAHGELIALEQVLVTYPGVPSSPLQPMPLLRRNKQL